MRVCPECLRICEDNVRYCPKCHYDLNTVILTPQERREKKRRKYTVTFLIIIAIVVALLLMAVFVIPEFILPDWIIERMQYGKSGVVSLPLPMGGWMAGIGFQPFP